MLLDSLDALTRVSSPDNLINRLRGLNNPASVIDIKSENDSVDAISKSELAVVEEFLESEGLVEQSSQREIPKLDELVPDALDKIKVNLAQATALDVLQESLNDLRFRMSEVDKPEKLSRIASDASKIISNLKPKEESGPARGSVIIYKPVVANISEYRTVKANE